MCLQTVLKSLMCLIIMCLQTVLKSTDSAITIEFREHISCMCTVCAVHYSEYKNIDDLCSVNVSCIPNH